MSNYLRLVRVKSSLDDAQWMVVVGKWGTRYRGYMAGMSGIHSPLFTRPPTPSGDGVLQV